jgi:hypothetical protein
VRIGVAFPTVRPLVAIDTIREWGKMGFIPLLMVNQETNVKKFDGVCGVIKKTSYEGYFREANLLCKILFTDAGCDVVVCAGDFIYPDPNVQAQDIAKMFGEKLIHSIGQPVYERKENGCWSPWIGKLWWRNMYRGAGPFHFEYFQFAGGLELEDVARKRGNYWETDSIHQHTIRRPDPDKDFFGKHNKTEYYERDMALYFERKRFGFEGANNESKLELPKHHGQIIMPEDLT